MELSFFNYFVLPKLYRLTTLALLYLGNYSSSDSCSIKHFNILMAINSEISDDISPRSIQALL